MSFLIRSFLICLALIVCASELSAQPAQNRRIRGTIESLDGTTKDIVVTVNGANDAATFGGDLSGIIGEEAAGPIGGTLTVNDIDTGESVFMAPDASALAGAYGVFVFDAATGAWTYDVDSALAAVQALNAGESLADKLTVKTLDGTATDIVVTIDRVLP